MILESFKLIAVANRVPPSLLAGYGVPEITEATALALMEDLASEAK